MASKATAASPRQASSAGDRVRAGRLTSAWLLRSAYRVFRPLNGSRMLSSSLRNAQSRDVPNSPAGEKLTAGQKTEFHDDRDPAGRAPSRRTRSAVAAMVPPVARTSSTISTRAPGAIASACTARVS